MNIKKKKIFKCRPQLKNYKKNYRKIPNKGFKLSILSLVLAASLVQAKPIMAVVVDDVGGSLRNCQILTSITLPLNIAVLPGTPAATKCAELINKSPHQLLIHFPWERLGRNYQKYYPIRIMRGMTAEEMAEMLNKALLKVPGAQGLNNHMGSTLSESTADMQAFMAILAKHKANKYFLDSNTSRVSRAYYWAKKCGIKTTKNNVFLDGRQNAEYIDGRFLYAVKLAEQQGSIVAICHGNRAVTLRVLAKMLEKYKQRVDFVYLPQLIEYRNAAEINIDYTKGI